MARRDNKCLLYGHLAKAQQLLTANHVLNSSSFLHAPLAQFLCLEPVAGIQIGINFMETTARDDNATKHLLIPNKRSNDNSPSESIIVYVLGGPGSGKGTQCSKIVEHFGYCHLNVGDLLQSQVESGSEYGKMIQELKKEGKLVPSDVVVKVLKEAMQRSQNKKFLIDGFPRNQENRVAAENVLKIEPNLVLFLDCSEEEMTRRLLNRNQGRIDDSIDTIKKRLKVYSESTLPVIDYYNSKGKVRKINGEKSIDEVFQEVEGVFAELNGSQGESKTHHT